MNTHFNQYLRTLYLEGVPTENYRNYPFSLKAIKPLKRLDFDPKVTYIIGENGSGKSTVLEAIAVAFGFNPEGGSINFNFSTEDTHSELCKYLKLSKGITRPKDGYFLRAESFYNVATYIDQLDREGAGGPPLIHSYGGLSLHNQSHGESFMALALNRLRGNGLYIFDEPEAALSPTRQLSLLSRIHQLVQQNSQFIIATHSPILMAYPSATIYNIDDEYREIQYTDTEHYQITKSFINCTELMLKELFKDD